MAKADLETCLITTNFRLNLKSTRKFSRNSVIVKLYSFLYQRRENASCRNRIRLRGSRGCGVLC